MSALIESRPLDLRRTVETRRQAWVGSPWLRGHRRAGGPGVLERAQAGSGWHDGIGRGHDTGAVAPKGTGLQQSGPAAALAYFSERLREQQGKEREIRGHGEVGYLERWL
jgi:hypothetical protein